MENTWNPTDNLIPKGFRPVKQDFPGLPAAQIHYIKPIPMGAGLGGGI